MSFKVSNAGNFENYFAYQNNSSSKLGKTSTKADGLINSEKDKVKSEKQIDRSKLTTLKTSPRLSRTTVFAVCLLAASGYLASLVHGLGRTKFEPESETLPECYKFNDTLIIKQLDPCIFDFTCNSSIQIVNTFRQGIPTDFLRIGAPNTSFDQQSPSQDKGKESKDFISDRFNEKDNIIDTINTENPTKDTATKGTENPSDKQEVVEVSKEMVTGDDLKIMKLDVAHVDHDLLGDLFPFVNNNGKIVPGCGQKEMLRRISLLSDSQAAAMIDRVGVSSTLTVINGKISPKIFDFLTEEQFNRVIPLVKLPLDSSIINQLKPEARKKYVQNMDASKLYFIMYLPAEDIPLLSNKQIYSIIKNFNYSGLKDFLTKLTKEQIGNIDITAFPEHIVSNLFSSLEQSNLFSDKQLEGAMLVLGSLRRINLSNDRREEWIQKLDLTRKDSNFLQAFAQDSEAIRSLNQKQVEDLMKQRGNDYADLIISRLSNDQKETYRKSINK